MSTSETGRRLGRPSVQEAVELREAFLSEALAMLLQRGVHGFSVEDLARRSGVTKRTIYRQFESKAALVEAVVERVAGHIITDAQVSDDVSAPPLERLRIWCWRSAQYLARYETGQLRILLRSASLTEQWAARMLERWAGRVINPGRLFIMAAQASGDLRAGDADELTRLLLDLVDGAFNPMNLYSAQRPPDNAELERRFKVRWIAFIQLARPD